MREITQHVLPTVTIEIFPPNVQNINPTSCWTMSLHLTNEFFLSVFGTVQTSFFLNVLNFNFPLSHNLLIFAFDTKSGNR